MHSYDSYKQPTSRSMPRIELVLAVFQKAIEAVKGARQAILEGQAAVGLPLLTKAQLLVASLATGNMGNADPVAVNFCLLYEFVCHRLQQGSLADLDGALRVLEILSDAFVQVRDQARQMEAQGALPSLDEDRQIRLTA